MILNEQGCLGPSAASCTPCLQVCPERSESLHHTLQWSWVLMATIPVGRQMSRWGQDQHLWVGWHYVHNFHFKEFRASLLRVHCSLGLSTSQSYLWYNYSGWKNHLPSVTSEQWWSTGFMYFHCENEKIKKLMCSAPLQYLLVLSTSYMPEG